MIPPPDISLSRHAALSGTGSDAQGLAEKEIEDIAVIAGAAVGTLDAVVRRQERWAGAWRRLALSAAAVTAKQAGRVEDEAALRDFWCLRPVGSGVPADGSATLGPASLLLLAWRRLAGRPAQDLLTAKNLAAVLEEFGYAPDAAVVGDLVDELQPLGAGMVATLTGAFIAAGRHGFGRAVGAWLADALLAQRLDWTYAVPLLGTEVIAGLGTRRLRRSATVSPAAAVETEPDGAKNLLAAQARAALRAIDLSAELARRADKLLAVAPKLRTRASDLVVERTTRSSLPK